MAIWFNSKYVKDGDTFLLTDDNKKYLPDIFKHKNINIVCTNDPKKYLYDNLYDEIKDVKLIGVTGTNGKTTTCYLIYQMLNSLGINTSYIGTTGFFCNDNKRVLQNTTPDCDLLYNLILESKESGCNTVVMEVSSQALKEDRVYGLLFDAIGVTNITQDHLDVHKTMEEYVNCKKKLINKTRNNKICVLNGDDEYYKCFINNDNNNIIIGSDVKISNVNSNLHNTSFNINNDNVKTSLIGDFNVFNFTIAHSIIKELGYNDEYVINISKCFKAPPGRMMMFEDDDNVIFIDYAHTPDAVKKVLQTVKSIDNNGILTIIGCGGNRDKTKRPLMGSVACDYSAKVIFTNDNPRHEDEKQIMNDILKGAYGYYDIIYDRREAIKSGIDSLIHNNVLMILGKGHEDYQIIGNDKFHFSDSEEVMNYIKKKKSL